MDYKNDPYFCILPFMALNTRPNGGVKPCSEVMGMSPIKQNTTEETLVDSTNPYHNLTKESLHDVWNGEFMKDFRNNRLNGKYSKFCEVCYQHEAKGIESKRLTNIKKHYDDNKHLVNEAAANNGYMNTMPVWWELRLSSICNEACRMCIPQTSSKMREEFAKFKDELPESVKQNTSVAMSNYARYGYLGDNDNFKQQLYDNLDTVKYIELHGGEPTNDKNMWEVVEHIVSTGHADHIHIHVHTNIHALKQRHVELWNHFKSGWIGVSIDAYKEENEYIRNGSSWEKIEENLKLLNYLGPQWTKWITSTIMVYNVCTMDRFVDWFIKYKKIHNMNDLNWYAQQLVTPELMRPEHVPLHVRLAAIDKIRPYIGTDNENVDRFIGDIIKMLESTYECDADSLAELLQYTKVLDEKRVESISVTFPHLAEMFNE